MTEREIAEVLRAVPCYICKQGHFPLAIYDHHLSPDILAMAHAVVERVVEPLTNPRACVDCEGDTCERCGGTGFYCVSCPTYRRAADMWQVALADRDARLARLGEVARALDAKLDAMEGPLNSVCGIAQIHSAPYVGPHWTEERQALTAALADARAGKP